MTLIEANPEARLDFDLPPALEAHEPPEARGLHRDDVRLMVTHKSDGHLVHAHFHDLPRLLEPGALLVLNRSGTLPAELTGLRSDGSPIAVHLSTRVPHSDNNVWALEMRTPAGARFMEGRIGELLFLPEGGTARILDAYPAPDRLVIEGSRLWTARLHLPRPLPEYLARHGKPIRYGHVTGEWPLSAYQTAYADTPGSAEMPSAGRPLTCPLLDQLRTHGVEIAQLLLHTGVSSQEAGETPFAEYFEVPAPTAEAVTRARTAGRPVIAVGTTVVRALESAAGKAAHGWTELVITPERGVRFVDGLITGWHEPRASHLLMLEAIAGRPLLEASYREAIRAGYLWHEFGDSQLILP